MMLTLMDSKMSVLANPHKVVAIQSGDLERSERFPRAASLFSEHLILKEGRGQGRPLQDFCTIGLFMYLFTTLSVDGYL